MIWKIYILALLAFMLSLITASADTVQPDTSYIVEAEKDSTETIPKPSEIDKTKIMGVVR